MQEEKVRQMAKVCTPKNVSNKKTWENIERLTALDPWNVLLVVGERKEQEECDKEDKD
jgi:hypothetical protein